MTKHELQQVAISDFCWQWLNPIDRWRRLSGRRFFRSERHAKTHELAHKTQAMVAARLRWLGFSVLPTSHKAAFDLLAGQWRIEVKASRWDGHRYGARLHNGDCDYLIWVILAPGGPVFYVIPAAELRGLRYIKITSQAPGAYAGKWARFREAWRLLEVR